LGEKAPQTVRAVSCKNDAEVAITEMVSDALGKSRGDKRENLDLKRKHPPFLR
jgi:hypothetical protein